MKKYYHTLLFVMLLSLTTAGNGIINDSQPAAADSYDAIIKPKAEEIVHVGANTAGFVTKNGKYIQKYAINNDGNQTLEITEIKIGSMAIPVKISLPAGKFLQYAKVEGFVIIPEGPNVINEKETSYFATSEKLTVRLWADSAESMVIYMPSKSRPVAVLSSRSITWEFDSVNSLLRIEATGAFVGNNTEIYLGENLPKIVFLEDTENAEVLEFRNSKAQNSANDVVSALLLKGEELEAVVRNFTLLNLSAEKLRDNVDAAQNEIAVASEDMLNLKRISQNRLIGPEILAGAFIVALLALYYAFNKRGMNDKK